MPASSLLPEVLAAIFSAIEKFETAVDLLSCCLVCRSWYFGALPLLQTDPSSFRWLRTQDYTTEDLERLGNVLAASRHYGLALGRAMQRVDIMYANVVSCQGTQLLAVLNQSRVDRLVRLMQALQPDIQTMSLDFYNSTNPDRLLLFNRLITQLTPASGGITTLRVLKLSFNTNSISARSRSKFPILIDTIGRLAKQTAAKNPHSDVFSRTHPIFSLLNTLHLNLTSIHLFESYLTPALCVALRRCRRIHTFRLLSVHTTVTPTNLSKTIASWPELHILSLCKLSAPLDIAHLSRSPPPHLTILELEGLVLHNAVDDLSRLVTACSATLTALTLPCIHYHPTNGGNLIEHLLVTPMPCFCRLDLSQLNFDHLNLDFDLLQLNRNCTSNSNNDGGDCTGVALLAWPELRELRLGKCCPFGIWFMRAVIENCPKLECIRAKNFGGWRCEIVVELLRERGFEERKLREVWEWNDMSWTRKGARFEEEEVRRSRWDEENGLLVRM
ncbi:hypothetical protein BC937DRAFT_92877 [Endogone sp. FLAS-F59071]|nr:hypothetical protein BC937DRAFT_92877 [Endogone sp. FLAS-F59071]|eukprot:RUS15118.1 hypothetical protein BC937DRAFT_92877 [Endogone sp. FLAS-F59071]